MNLDTLFNFFSGIKILHYLVYVLLFVIYGAFFLLPFPWRPQSLDFVQISFTNKEAVIQFILFAYAIGLILYALNILCFRLWRRLFGRNQSQNSSKSKSDKFNDIDIILFREKHGMVADTFTLLDFISQNVRLLFSASLVLLILLLPSPSWRLVYLIVICIILFALGLIVDREINQLGQQVGDYLLREGAVNNSRDATNEKNNYSEKPADKSRLWKIIYSIGKFVGVLAVSITTIWAGIVTIISFPVIKSEISKLTATANLEDHFSIFGESKLYEGQEFSTPIGLDLYIDNDGEKETDFWRETILVKSRNFKIYDHSKNVTRLESNNPCGFYLVDGANDYVLPFKSFPSRVYGNASPDVRASFKVGLSQRVFNNPDEVLFRSILIGKNNKRPSLVKDWFFREGKVKSEEVAFDKPFECL